MWTQSHPTILILILTTLCSLKLSSAVEEEPPVVEANGNNAFTVTEGSAVTLEVKFASDATVADIQGYQKSFLIVDTSRTYSLDPNYDRTWTRNEMSNGDAYGCNRDALTCYLEVASVTIQDSGENKFTFQANTRFSMPTVVSFTVNVLVPPRSIEIEGGAEVVVVKDVSTNLTCKVERANPVPVVYWMVNGVRQAPNHQISTKVKSGADEGHFNVDAVITFTPTMGGIAYECHAEGQMMQGIDMVGRTTTVLHYKPTVTITTEPPNAAYKAGESIKAVCNSAAVPPVTSWVWTVGETTYDSTQSGTRSSIDITVDASMNALPVTCTATNSIAETAASNTLNIHYAAEFLSTPPVTHPADIGDSLSFECTIDGNPDPTVIWSKVIQDETGEGAVIMSGSSQYSIDSVSEESFGQYRCQGVVRGFPTIEHTFYVLKKGKPSIRSRDASSSAQGRTAELECMANCVPGYTDIIWTQVGQPNVNLASHNRYRVNNVITTEGVVSKLIIDNVVSTDYTDYNCTVVNDRGQDTRIFQLIHEETFSMMHIGIGVGVAVAVVVAIVMLVCCCKRKERKTKKAFSAGSSSTGYWLEPSHPGNFRNDCQNFPSSLSEVSNGTENSIKKPADGMETITQLPEYSGPGPVDMWHTDTSRRPMSPCLCVDDTDAYHKPELYGTFRGQPAHAYNRSYDRLPTVHSSNHGSYRVQHPAMEGGGTNYCTDSYPHVSTLPSHPHSRRYPDGMENPPPNAAAGSKVDFPQPPASFLATNV